MNCCFIAIRVYVSFAFNQFTKDKPAMKLKAIFFVLVIITQSVFAYGESLSSLLKKYNNLEISEAIEHFQSLGSPAESVFEGYTFECKKQQDYNPKESPEARKSFETFLAYFNSHPAPTVEQKKYRLSLLEEAIKAGSWRAAYFDLMWQLWDNRGDREALETLSEQLVTMTNEGTPVVIYAYLMWTMSWLQGEERYKLFKVAIDRGSPQAMEVVGAELAMKSKKLGSMGKEMLTCAISQGNPNAYATLGTIAMWEGHLVDAYRLFEKGTNSGCSACAGRMKNFARLEPDFQSRDSTYTSNDYTLRSINEFYNKQQFVYELTYMHELLEKLPEYMEFHVTDRQIVDLIQLDR
jgi:hypothetical protein